MRVRGAAKKALGLLGALLGLVATSPALPHEWYSLECCHNEDCSPVPSTVRIEKLEGGAYKVGSAIVPKEKVRQSQDGDWHWCREPAPNGYGDFLIVCLYVPMAF